MRRPSYRRSNQRGRGWRRVESSSPYRLLLNALLIDFGFVEEFWHRGGVKLKITDLGRDYLPELEVIFKEKGKESYAKRKKN